MRQDGFTAKHGSFYKNVEKDGNVIALQASNYYDQQFFSIGFSAPKLIYGTNVEMLQPNDLPFVLDTINEIVAGETRIDFDANAADVMANHFCHNWKFDSESDVYAYADEMKLLTYKYKIRSIHAKENGVDTIYWRNKLEEILFYPKHAETARLAKKGKVSSRYLAQTIGMLRWEHRLLDAKKIKAFAAKFGCSKRADSFLPHLSEMTRETLLNDMKILGLDKTIEVTGERERLRKLKDYCGDNTRKYQNLCALLHNADVFGIDNIVSLGLINPNTFRTRKAEIKKADISFSKPTNGRILPPLPTPRFENDLVGGSDAGLYHTAFNKTDICSTRSKSLIQMSGGFVN
jgi:hypothetical protein